MLIVGIDAAGMRIPIGEILSMKPQHAEGQLQGTWFAACGCWGGGQHGDQVVKDAQITKCPEGITCKPLSSLLKYRRRIGV